MMLTAEQVHRLCTHFGITPTDVLAMNPETTRWLLALA